MTEQLKFIPLSDISLIKNYRDVEPPSEKDEDVIELSKSVAKFGVMQAILLREHPDQPGKYQLIFGHRRFLASRVAKLETIPASIKEVADDDILDLQVTENLQRKDVHPMDEAVAFQLLMKRKSYSIEEIGARFAKKPEFIAQRLKLNDLAPELQKDFKANKMLVGHALLICRLGHNDQLTLKKNRFSAHEGYGSVSNIQDYIERHVIHKLSAAPFKLNDVTLNPGAGPCHTCPKRSGANRLLFADVKEDDRCFDAGCFQAKLDAHFLTELRNIIETKPNIILVKDRHDNLPKPVTVLLKEMKVDVLGDDKWDSYGYGKNKKSTKAFYLTGYHRGEEKTIYIQGSAAKTDKSGKKIGEDPKILIEGIKTREKRSKELDLEKIHKATLDEVNKLNNLKTPGLKHQGVADRGIMVFLLLEMAHSGAAGHADDIICKNLKNLPKESARGDKGYHPDYIKKLGAVTDDQLAYIVRTICLGMYGNRNLVYGIDIEDTTLRMIAEYAGVDVKAIEKAQGEISLKRQDRVAKRIKDLQATKKDTAAPTKTVKGKVSPKKAAKTKAKPVEVDEDEEDDE